jgi:hypothetical protein
MKGKGKKNWITHCIKNLANMKGYYNIQYEIIMISNLEHFKLGN